MGKAKRGKSTLINALLGRTDDAVAPIDRLPTSSAVSRFRHGPAEAATVVFRDDRREAIPYGRIRDFVTEESNPGNRKGVNVVEVEGPFAGLEDGLVLVDTPGAGSIHEHHDQLLHQFIPEADAVIFLVTARMPLDRDELDLLRELRAAEIRKIFFAINRVDECSDEDLKDAIEHNRALLDSIGISIDRMYPISARRAYRGDLGSSGLPDLIRDVSSLSARDRARVLEERFLARVLRLVEPAVQELEFAAVAAQRTEAELHDDLAALRRRRGDLESTRELAEREFLHAWNAALDRMEHGLEVEQGRVRAELVRHVGAAGLLDVRKLAGEMPTWLNRTLEDHLHIVGQAFEEQARAACEKLQADYPAVGVQEGMGVLLRTRAGNELISGAVGGLALTATGIGVASAASTAAAGIAAANAAALAATTTVSAPSLLSAWAHRLRAGRAGTPGHGDGHGVGARRDHDDPPVGRPGRAGRLDPGRHRGAGGPLLVAPVPDEAQGPARGRVHRAGRSGVPPHQAGSHPGPPQDGPVDRGRVPAPARPAGRRARGGDRRGVEEVDGGPAGRRPRIPRRPGPRDPPPDHPASVT